jgi:hypothetical protein
LAVLSHACDAMSRLGWENRFLISWRPCWRRPCFQFRLQRALSWVPALQERACGVLSTTTPLSKKKRGWAHSPITAVAFKAVATIGQDQATVDFDGNPVTLAAKGRHDPCVVPRAVPVVEAMAALVLADCYLRHQQRR